MKKEHNKSLHRTSALTRLNLCVQPLDCYRSKYERLPLEDVTNPRLSRAAAKTYRSTSWSLIRLSLDPKPGVFSTTQQLTAAHPIGGLSDVSRMCQSPLASAGWLTASTANSRKRLYQLRNLMQIYPIHFVERCSNTRVEQGRGTSYGRIQRSGLTCRGARW